MAVEEECQHEISCSALARKRRTEFRQQHRLAQQVSEEPTEDVPQSSKRKRPIKDEGEPSESKTRKSKIQPSVTGIKKQARYVPGVPMTKDELVSWRKDARRVRNRLSAAESRQKTRDRIEELEDQMGGLQNKFDAAMERILELEDENGNLKNSCQYSSNIILKDCVVSPCASPKNDLSRPSTPPSPYVLSSDHEGVSHQVDANKKYQHIIEMISLPHA